MIAMPESFTPIEFADDAGSVFATVNRDGSITVDWTRVQQMEDTLRQKTGLASEAPLLDMLLMERKQDRETAMWIWFFRQLRGHVREISREEADEVAKVGRAGHD